MTTLSNTSDYQAQLSAKVDKIQQLFSEFNLPKLQVFESKPSHYRMRAEFRVWHEQDDLYYIMFNQQTKQKYRVDEFPVACDLINAAMKQLLTLIKSNQTLRRKLFQVDFLASQTNELLISLLYHKALDEEWQEQASALQQAMQSIAKVKIIGRARKQKWVLDQDFVNETLSVDGKQFHYRQVENSFTQPNAGINEKMLSWARNISADLGGDLIELYCGNGNFSIALAEFYNRVLATEISKSSVDSAQINIAQNNISNLHILRMSSEEFTQAMNGEREFRRLKGFDLSSYGYETVLVDPPRAGLDEQSIKLIQKFNNIIYISCNPETLKQNLSHLTQTHNINQFALFDQFPFTEHIESGVFLQRK